MPQKLEPTRLCYLAKYPSPGVALYCQAVVNLMQRGSKPSSYEVNTVYLHRLALIPSHISRGLANAIVRLLSALAHLRVFRNREAAIVRNRSLGANAIWINFHQNHIFPDDDLFDLFFPKYLSCTRAPRSTSNVK